MKMTTTIKIQKDTRDKLIILKVHKAKSNIDEVINYLLEMEAKNENRKI